MHWELYFTAWLILPRIIMFAENKSCEVGFFHFFHTIEKRNHKTLVSQKKRRTKKKLFCCLITFEQKWHLILVVHPLVEPEAECKTISHLPWRKYTRLAYLILVAVTIFKIGSACQVLMLIMRRKNELSIFWSRVNNWRTTGQLSFAWAAPAPVLSLDTWVKNPAEAFSKAASSGCRNFQARCQTNRSPV